MREGVRTLSLFIPSSFRMNLQLQRPHDWRQWDDNVFVTFEHLEASQSGDAFVSSQTAAFPRTVLSFIHDCDSDSLIEHLTYSRKFVKQSPSSPPLQQSTFTFTTSSLRPRDSEYTCSDLRTRISYQGKLFFIWQVLQRLVAQTTDRTL